jgi:predicted RNA-binding Zn ribbon-like protein
LKACRNADCHWIFYDATKNRSGAWCEMGLCGNRAKARSYRERHRPGVAGS